MHLPDPLLTDPKLPGDSLEGDAPEVMLGQLGYQELMPVVQLLDGATRCVALLQETNRGSRDDNLDAIEAGLREAAARGARPSSIPP